MRRTFPEQTAFHCVLVLSLHCLKDNFLVVDSYLLSLLGAAVGCWFPGGWAGLLCRLRSSGNDTLEAIALFFYHLTDCKTGLLANTPSS